MRRIVEETLADGTKQYRVETNRWFFDLLPCKWTTDICTTYYSFGEVTLLAVFSTLKEAQIYCGIDPNPIVKREIIVENG